tara:strand:- start:481 stop:951 length:471 start_codon:yes stop_codon:yes gene_type:complete
MNSKLMIVLLGMCLCGCELFPKPNADWVKNIFRTSARDVFPPPPVDRINNPPPPIGPNINAAAVQAKAKAGDPDAQYKLATSYQLGEGMGRDDVAAYKWYTIAAGSSSAGKKLKAKVTFNKKTLAARMTRAQIAEAEKSTEEFHNVPGPGPIPDIQ